MIHPEVQGALVGIGGGGIVIFGKIAFDYLRLKITKNGKMQHVCPEHERVIATLTRIEGYFEDEHHIKLYMEAIKRVNNENTNER